jgi:pyruvate dehydrogenase E2 component (dihydrolipoamide acetyltransferase)
MATKVLMEALSPTMEEGRITSWLKQEGAAVSVGDVLAEVETDKAVMELQARGDGVLRKILVAEGKTADVGSLVAIIAGKDEDLGDLAGTPPAAPKDAPTPSPSVPAAAAPAAPPATSDRVKASPLARRIAGEKQIDLAQVAGSGPSGRIIKRDVEGAGPATAASGGWNDVPLSQVRKTIAKRLSQSIGPIPHFFLTAEADMERAAEARAALNAQGDAKISFNDIILKVVATALTQHTACNAWWQDDHIRYFREVHIGVAVAIKDGLITPVIRHADRKSLRAIAAEVRALADRAREKKLKPEEYTGATFSVSNLGMFGIDEFTAVINPPEAGILAVGALTERPVVVDGQVAVRKRLRVTMSCDHRVIDGATGAQFLQTVVRMLENPLALVW